MNYTMKNLRHLVFVSHLILALMVSRAAGKEAEHSSAEVTIANGVLAGVAEADGMRSFKGIPYAQPPVDGLRWREPQPVRDWTGVRRADQFGPRPMQPTLWSDMIFRSSTMSEDCLYLNVWTATTEPGARLPVLVFFHGGGMIAGDGSEPRYDGASMARKGIVMVTINYRLGIFGFLAHPELTKESAHHASGNYGFLDQNAALRWVQRNIAAFGGDPRRVTIGGQSAGATSVCAQMASPLSRDLFVGAIGQSGSALGSGNASLSEGEQAGVAFAASVGADSLTALRHLSPDVLLKASTAYQFSRRMLVDGYFFTEPASEIFFTGRQADVPLLAGWTSAEVGLGQVLGQNQPTVTNYQNAVRQLYGANADAVLRLYPAGELGAVAPAATDLASDRFAGYRTWKWIDLHSKSGGSPVFRYLFDQPLPEEKSSTELKVGNEARVRALGSPHSSDIPYALGNLGLVPAYAWTDADRATSETLQQYFVNFVRNGNPNSASLPHWPWIQASIPQVMVIREKALAEPEKNSKRYLLLDSF